VTIIKEKMTMLLRIGLVEEIILPHSFPVPHTVLTFVVQCLVWEQGRNLIPLSHLM